MGGESMAAYTHNEAVSFIWSVADIIRGAGFHQSDYGDVTLPFMVRRRLDQASQQTYRIPPDLIRALPAGQPVLLQQGW